MATSTINVYNLNKVNAEENIMIDNIATVLESITPIYSSSDFQYVKHDLDIQVKVPLPQTYLNRNSCNYVSIKNSDDLRTFYYWIVNRIWKSENTIELILSLDTLNTFEDKIKGHFTSKTSITREHKDRFVERLNNKNVKRKIDITSEFQGLTKYQTSSENIKGTDDDLLNPSGQGANKWYLVYTNDNATPVSNPDSNHAVNVYLIPKETLSVYVPPGEEEDIYLNYFLYPTQSDKFVIFGIQANCNFTINGNNYTIPDNDHFIIIHCSGQSYDIAMVDKVNSTVTNLGYCAYPSLITFNSKTYISQTLDLNNYTGSTFAAKFINAYNDVNTNLYRWSFAATGMHELLNIRELNKTLSYLIKIVACPYFPLDYEFHSTGVMDIPPECKIVRTIELGNSYTKDALQLISVDENLLTLLRTDPVNEFNVTLPEVEDRLNTGKDPIYESKLYHSDFYNYIYNYDSFNKLIPLENIDSASTWTPLTTIYYKQSNNAKSDLGFEFINTQWVRKSDSYEKYLICSRNNEKAIYNSSYLNYIRNGYNYDVKNKQLAESKAITTAAIGVGTSLTAGLAGAMINPVLGIAAGLVSAATTAITSGVNIHYQNIQAEQAIEQKIQEAKATANSIIGSDDLDLLEWYNGNYLILNKFAISDKQKSNIFELFYNNGYACSESKIPNLDSRQMFNFLQANIDLDTKNDADLIKYYTDIKTRFQSGVTDIHNYNLYDKTKENWESWIQTS